MFDIGFSELMVLAVVALIVIGPERLPAVARTLGHLFGRLQRYVNDVKADISREIELDELRKFRSEFEQAAQSVESGVREEMTKAESAVDSITKEAEAAVAGFDPLGETAAAVQAPVSAEEGGQPVRPPDAGTKPAA